MADRLAEGCSFFARCSLRLPGVCDTASPPARTLSTDTMVRCVQPESALRAGYHPAEAVLADLG
jgi:ABC-type dipeptide/oligopeptide/nickel transport system ATPase component